MKTFLYLISIFWLLIGITALLYPLKLKELYTHIIKSIDPPTLCGGHSKPLFFLPLIFGLLFLWARPASSLKPLISVLAAISFLKAIFLLVCPYTLLKSFFNRILSLPLVFYRVEGVFIVGLGVVVIFSIL